MITWTATNPLTTAPSGHHIVNSLIGLSKMYPLSDLIIPDTHQFGCDLKMAPAMQALAIHTGSLCYRLAHSSFSSANLINRVVTNPSLKFASLGASLSGPIECQSAVSSSYRIATNAANGIIGVDCSISDSTMLPPESPLAPQQPPGAQRARSSRPVSCSASAEWTSAEPLHNLITSWAHDMSALRRRDPSRLLSEYGIDSETWEDAAEFYIGLAQEQ
eukprot:CRZ05042.1 hypothetical protein [Spongospora subterranea]